MFAICVISLAREGFFGRAGRRSGPAVRYPVFV